MELEAFGHLVERVQMAGAHIRSANETLSDCSARWHFDKDEKAAVLQRVNLALAVLMAVKSTLEDKQNG